MSRKKLLQIFCVVVSFATLLWLLRRIGWPTIAGALASVGWISATLLFLLALAEGCLDGLSLRIIAGPSIRTGFAVMVNSAGSMLNLILPWESGELLKGSLVNGPLGTSKAVSSVIIWNYVFKLSRPAFALLAALLAYVLCGDIPVRSLKLVVAANVLGFLPYVVLRLAIRLGATGKLVKLVSHLPFLRRSPTQWVDLARTIDGEVRSFWRDRPWAYVQVFLLQFIARSTGCLSLLVGFRAVGLPYGFDRALLLHATMNVAEYFIGLLPARVGVGESTAYLVFKFYGFNAPLGLVLYTFLRARNILLHGLITPFAFVSRRTSGEPQPTASSPPKGRTHE